MYYQHSNVILIFSLLGLCVACQQTDYNKQPSTLLTAHNSDTQTIITTQNVASTKEVKAIVPIEASKDHPKSVPILQSTKKYDFPWLGNYDAANMLVNRIAVPSGYERVSAASGTFAEWLHHLPLKSGKPDVLLYNGSKKGNQSAHYAVVNMDVGNKDLQQCADAVMRLRAEYLYGTEQSQKIQFNFTNGEKVPFDKWQQGYTIRIKNDKVQWVASANATSSYTSFKQYLIKVFTYAGTYSLSKELKKVAHITDIQAGDVFIQGGFPGHAVIVIDVAQHPHTKEKIFMLAQSYMPAQEIHLLNNPSNANLSPWYSTTFEGNLHTPEWTFSKADLKRF